MKKIIYTKSEHWSYEQEWRMSGGAGFIPTDVVELNAFAKEDLTAVVFGCRASKEFIKKTVDRLKLSYPKTEIFQAKLSKTAYEVVIKNMR